MKLLSKKPINLFEIRWDIHTYIHTYIYIHTHTRVYPNVSGLAAWSENCKW